MIASSTRKILDSADNVLLHTKTSYEDEGNAHNETIHRRIDETRALSHVPARLDVLQRIWHPRIFQAMENTKDDFEIDQAEHPDEDRHYTMNDLVNGFEEQGFGGNMYSSFEEFCQEELRDEEYIQGFIDRNQRDTELRHLYREFLSHEEENQQERFETLVDKIAHAAANRANLSIGEYEYGKNDGAKLHAMSNKEIQKAQKSMELKNVPAR